MVQTTGPGAAGGPTVAREVVTMSVWWIILLLIVLVLAWAGWRTRGRDRSSGPELRGDRHRRTGGYDGVG